jgi:centrosomal protein CEP120
LYRYSEAEHRRGKEDNAALEKRLAAAVAVVEERERRLIAAEESLSTRREAERREMAQRMSEAQHAVRRLQQECEHQLEMEKGRSADVDRQKAVLEERLDEANARAAAVERAFHGGVAQVCCYTTKNFCYQM